MFHKKIGLFISISMRHMINAVRSLTAGPCVARRSGALFNKFA
jgi:hypothetical protein